MVRLESPVKVGFLTFWYTPGLLKVIGCDILLNKERKENSRAYESPGYTSLESVRAIAAVLRLL